MSSFEPNRYVFTSDDSENSIVLRSPVGISKLLTRVRAIYRSIPSVLSPKELNNTSYPLSLRNFGLTLSSRDIVDNKQGGCLLSTKSPLRTVVMCCLRVLVPPNVIPVYHDTKAMSIVLSI